MKTLFLLGMTFFSLNSLFAADTVSVFVYPPSYKINWKTPRSMVKSLFRTEIYKEILPSGKKITSKDTWGEETENSTVYRADLGHVISHINCTLSNGEKFERYSSVSGEEYPEVDYDNLFKKKIGMGLLFFDYYDGHVISGDENLALMLYYRGRDYSSKKIVRPRYIQFEIDQKQCDSAVKMIRFYEKFHYQEDLELSELMARPNEDVLLFSANVDPYETYLKRLNMEDVKVGGTCASYGIGVLKAANLYDNELDSYLKLKIDVSEKLIGTDDNSVSLKSILFGKVGNRWSDGDSSVRRLENFDPQKIWDFIGTLGGCVGDKNSDCELKNLNWYNQNMAKIEKGEPLILKSQNGKKLIKIEGVLIKSK